MMLKNSRKAIILRNIAVALLLCNLLYFYLPIRPIVWRMLFVVVSFIATFSKGNKRSRIENAILVFIGLNVFYFIISYLWLVPSTTFLGNVLFGLTSFLLFAFLGRSGVLSSRFVLVSTLLLLMASILYFKNALITASAEALSFNEDNFTNNASVLFLYLLPSIIFIQDKKARFVFLLTCIFFLISGVKRGNILAAILPVIIILADTFKDDKKSLLKKVGLFIIFCAMFFVIQDWIISNDYFLLRLEDTFEGGLSERDQLYGSAWSLWSNSSSISHILFGYGFDATITYLPSNLRAHNDWLEILVNYGLLGVISYFAIFIGLIRLIKNSCPWKSKITFISIMTIWLLKSCYSMGFTDEFLALLAIPFGVAMSMSKKSL